MSMFNIIYEGGVPMTDHQRIVQSDLSDKTVIYIPTETNLPILESTRMNKIKSQHAPTATHE